jgi:hypothetical protein
VKNNLKQFFSSFVIFSNAFLIFFVSLLFIYNENANQLNVIEIVRPLLSGLFLLLFLGVLIFIIFRSKQKTAALLFVLCLVFILYGHVLNLLNASPLLSLAKHRVLSPIALILIVFFILEIRKQEDKVVEGNNKIITLVLIFLFIYNFSIFLNGYFLSQIRFEPRKSGLIISHVPPLSNTQLPDIYWIILDGYERKDVLLDKLNFDNSDFYEKLEDRGFVIPNCTMSNYSLTALSLSTAINMDYIENLTLKPLTKKGKLEYKVFFDLLSNSEMKRLLSIYGYKTVAFDTGYKFTRLTNVDYFISLDDKSLIYGIFHPVLSNFEEMYLETTIIQIVFDAPIPVQHAFQKVLIDSSKDKYDLLQNGFNKLEEVPMINGRKFVFAHLLPTHSPFVQSPTNDYVLYGDSDEGYLNSIIATNSRIIEIIDSIIQNSPNPPVIIIQGDHGMNSQNTKILNAYYLPGINSEMIPKDISPVNSFRLVLNSYFGFKLPLLDNVSYFSSDLTDQDNLTIISPSCDDKLSVEKSEDIIRK